MQPPFMPSSAQKSTSKPGWKKQASPSPGRMTCVLHQMVLAIEPGWAGLQPFLISLNPFAVAYRYPGISATRADSKDALKNCREVRRVIRTSFGLPV